MSKKFLFWVCSLSKSLIGFCIFESWFMSFSVLIILIISKPWETSGWMKRNTHQSFQQLEGQLGPLGNTMSKFFKYESDSFGKMQMSCDWEAELPESVIEALHDKSDIGLGYCPQILFRPNNKVRRATDSFGLLEELRIPLDLFPSIECKHAPNFCDRFLGCRL
ncbi:hypothetical protein DVH24_037663 [Malus domestica]|uniref:Uncharacterized protein n=1 Tax=Malus domestica TaxID=3750 RepID=A0A498IXG1_MALDO|nr:hypothetical protein DVH24_037663 [Malus domestica]